MDAFEKWLLGYAQSHPMYSAPTYRERFLASESFLAGRRAGLEEAARLVAMKPGDFLLLLGELTSREMRVARAVTENRVARILKEAGE